MLSLGIIFKSGYTTRSFLVQSIQPRRFSPILNHLVTYADACNPDPCGGGGRSSGRKRCGARRGQPPKSGSCHKICYKSYVETGYVDHDYKNMSLKRPMSPHLEIFKMTSAATMSILQRATGVILVFYAILLAGGTLFLSNGIETYVSIIQSLDLSKMTVSIIKLCIGLPFAFHYCNGIRFCMWNLAMSLDKKQVASTTLIALAGSVAIAVAFAFI